MGNQSAAVFRDDAMERLPGLLTASFGDPADSAVAGGPFACRGGGKEGLEHYEVRQSVFVAQQDVPDGVAALGSQLDGFSLDDSDSTDEARPKWVFYNDSDQVIVQYTVTTGVLVATWLTACGPSD